MEIVVKLASLDYLCIQNFGTQSFVLRLIFTSGKVDYCLCAFNCDLWTQNVFLLLLAPPLAMCGCMFISPLTTSWLPNTSSWQCMCHQYIQAHLGLLPLYRLVNYNSSLRPLPKKINHNVTSTSHKILATYAIWYVGCVATLATINTWKKNGCTQTQKNVCIRTRCIGIVRWIRYKVHNTFTIMTLEDFYYNEFLTTILIL
jgi:hypothetical protein